MSVARSKRSLLYKVRLLLTDYVFEIVALFQSCAQHAQRVAVALLCALGAHGTYHAQRRACRGLCNFAASTTLVGQVLAQVLLHAYVPSRYTAQSIYSPA